MGGSAPRPARPAEPRAIPSRYADILPLLWLLCFLAAYASLKRSFGILTCDDAFITLGHVRSWVEGLGPVMSDRNPVSATSTPLHTAQLALLAPLLRIADLGALAFWVNLAWDLIAFFFFYRIATELLGLSRPFACAALCAYALSVLALAVSAYGMETSLYTALALSGAWFAFSPRSQAFSPGFLAVCFLAPLARPEGVLLPAVLIPLRLLRRDRPWRHAAAYAAAAAAGLALFFAFYQWAYGHPLPHSVVAKRLGISIGLLDSLLSWWLNVFHKGPALGGRTVVTALNLLVILGAALGFSRRRGAQPFPWLLLAWPAAYFLFFLLSGASYVWSTWYYLPVLPFLMLALFAGLDRLAANRLTPAHWAVPFLLLAAITAGTYAQDVPARHRQAHAAREGRYIEAARILDSASAGGPIPLVMFDEIGALAYHSRARILDNHGLLSPEALPFLGKPPDDWKRMRALRDKLAPDWILAARPAEHAGKPQDGEEGIYAGYGLFRSLPVSGNPYVIELWRRESF